MLSVNKANVLLVDDRPENLLAMQSILEDLQQNLVCASSGHEALRFLLTEEVALILLDVQMPGLNGFEFAELVRERERTQHTPIIFVSAASRDEQYVFKGYSLGAVDYITKPFEPEILRSKVRFFSRLYLQNQEIKRQAELLENANSELDILNSELESRVRRRTAQLEAANRELEKEVSVRKQSEARLATEHAITRTLAAANSFELSATAILRTFCEFMEADISCLWMPDESLTVLSCTHIEYVGEADGLAPFIGETRRMIFEKGKGLPGEVWKKNAPVWLTDTVKAKNFPRATFAAAAGLNSAIGFPIKTNYDFHGMIEFFTRRPMGADRRLMNMVEAIGSEIGQFIQRRRLEIERENLLLREKSLREKAEVASRLKDEFLATVSHELRTPLNAIIGWGQILQTGKLSAEKQASAIETIYRNAKSQAQLINDLLDTSRLMTGNLLLNLSPTDVVPVIESTIESVRPAADAKAIKFTTDFRAEAEQITCDPQRLQQIVWNLLTNAVKFTPVKGEISVALEQGDETMRIIVRDNGEGIPPEFLPFVFERFRQADSSSTRKHTGLGLGLAIVRHLTELHGGFVTVESEGKSKGAVFTVTMPLSLATETHIKAVHKPNNHQPSEKSQHRLKGIRVMIVDDDADTCELLTYALKMLGAETQASQSVAEAFASMNLWKPDILLTDINMPGEDGYALINKLRAMPAKKGANIPAIALTALARPEDGEQVLSAGFQLHLAKPVDIEELTQAISNLARRAAAR